MPTPGYNTEHQFPQAQCEKSPWCKTPQKNSVLCAYPIETNRHQPTAPFPYRHVYTNGEPSKPPIAKSCIQITASCSKKLKKPQKRISCQMPRALSPESSGDSGPHGALTPTQGQVIKKLFVDLDWIDHSFPKFLFPSFTHYTPPPDGRGHLLAPAFIALANGNIVQRFPGILSFIYWLRDWSIFRGRKELKYHSDWQQWKLSQYVLGKAISAFRFTRLFPKRERSRATFHINIIAL